MTVAWYTDSGQNSFGMPTSPIVTHSAARDPIFGPERELARLNELVDGLPERGADGTRRGRHRKVCFAGGGEPARGSGGNAGAAHDRGAVRGPAAVREGCTSSCCQRSIMPTGPQPPCRVDAREDLAATRSRFFKLLDRPEAQTQVASLLKWGLQQRIDTEFDLAEPSPSSR